MVRVSVVWAITNSICLAITIASAVLIYTLKIEKEEQVLALYAIPASIMIASLTVSTVILIMGYLSSCASSRAWTVHFSFYLLFEIALHIVSIGLVSSRNSFAVSQMKKYYSSPLFNKTLAQIEGNLSCCGYDLSNESLSRCREFSFSVLCTDAANEKLGPKLPYVKAFLLTIIVTLSIHIIELNLEHFCISAEASGEGYLQMSALALR